MMRCVEIKSIDGFTSCTAVQPHGTAVEVMMLHSSRTDFVFCEPPIQIFFFFNSVFRLMENTNAGSCCTQFFQCDYLGAQWCSGFKLTCNIFFKKLLMHLFTCPYSPVLAPVVYTGASLKQTWLHVTFSQ